MLNSGQETTNTKVMTTTVLEAPAAAPVTTVLEAPAAAPATTVLEATAAAPATYLMLKMCDSNTEGVHQATLLSFSEIDELLAWPFYRSIGFFSAMPGTRTVPLLQIAAPNSKVLFQRERCAWRGKSIDSPPAFE